MKFPNDTKIRTFQFDSFFIECVKKRQDSHRHKLLPAEQYHLFKSESYLHDFCDKATLDTKIAILTKMEYHYAITVYDDEEGCDIIKWNEQIRAARGLETALEWFDRFQQFSHTFIIGSFEVRRILNRLEVMYHSTMARTSRYITRLRDQKRVGKYNKLKQEDDSIYFLLKTNLTFQRILAYDQTLGLDKKEIAILLFLYLEHRAMEIEEIDEHLMQVTRNLTTSKAIKTLLERKLIEKASHPYNFQKPKKRYSYLVSELGLDFVRQITAKILAYV